MYVCARGGRILCRPNTNTARRFRILAIFLSFFLFLFFFSCHLFFISCWGFLSVLYVIDGGAENSFVGKALLALFIICLANILLFSGIGDVQ